MPASKEVLLTFLIISLVYHAVFWPFFSHAYQFSPNIISIFYVFLFPAIIGVFLGNLPFFSVWRNLLWRIGLQPVHPLPTAWDYCFSRLRAGLIEVTLSDGSIIYGWLNPNRSFASSSEQQNDLLIGCVLQQGDSGNLIPHTPNRYIYLSKNQIKWIVFFEYEQGADR
jgi:hypothetical protein